MNEYKESASPRIDVPGIITTLNDILSGPDAAGLNIPFVTTLRAELSAKLGAYRAAVAGIEAIRGQDTFGTEPTLSHQQFVLLRIRSDVETYCTIDLVAHLSSLLATLPDAAETRTLASRLRAIRETLTRTADSNTPDDGVRVRPAGPQEERNRAAGGPPPMSGRAVADNSLLAALRDLVEEMMVRVRKAQRVLYAFDAPSSASAETREEQPGLDRPKPAWPNSGITNDPDRAKEPRP